MKTSLCAITLLFTLVSFVASGQAQKGDRLVGASVANLSFRSTDQYKSSSIQLTPHVGWLVTNKTIVGVGLPIFLVTSKYTSPPLSGFRGSSFLIGVAPFVRQFLTEGRVRPYIGAGLSFTYSNTVVKGAATNGGELRNNDKEFGGNVGAGVAFFLNRSVSVDVAATYNRSFKNDSRSSGLVYIGGPVNGFTQGNALNIGLGFTIFLPKAGVGSQN
jgi:hypothetical protein